MKSVAVFYATREGQTQKIAERIQADLQARGLQVRLEKVSSTTPFGVGSADAVILAASVHAGHHEKEMVNFVKLHRDELNRIPTSFISVTLSQAGYQRCACDVAKRDEFARDIASVIDQFFLETGWEADCVKPVAGALVYQHYNPFIRFVMRRIAEKSGGDTDTSRNYEYTDWADLDRFVDELTDQISRATKPFQPALPSTETAHQLT